MRTNNLSIHCIAYGMVINYKRPTAPHSDTAYTTSIFVMTRLSIPSIAINSRVKHRKSPTLNERVQSIP